MPYRRRKGNSKKIWLILQSKSCSLCIQNDNPAKCSFKKHIPPGWDSGCQHCMGCQSLSQASSCSLNAPYFSSAFYILNLQDSWNNKTVIKSCHLGSGTTFSNLEAVTGGGDGRAGHAAWLRGWAWCLSSLFSCAREFHAKGAISKPSASTESAHWCGLSSCLFCQLHPLQAWEVSPTLRGGQHENFESSDQLSLNLETNSWSLIKWSFK